MSSLFLKSLDVSASLNQEVKDVEEAILQFQNRFSTCIVILTGDGKGMQAMGGAGSKCWLCKDPDGIFEPKEAESPSRWGAFLEASPLTDGLLTTNMQHAES